MEYRKQGEYATCYRDTGCEFAPSCLNCPFPDCIEDKLKREKNYEKARARREQILRLIGEGKSRKEIAAEVGVSRRTIWRATKSLQGVAS